jgi:hypothetical protein
MSTAITVDDEQDCGAVDMSLLLSVLLTAETMLWTPSTETCTPWR